MSTTDPALEASTSPAGSSSTSPSHTDRLAADHRRALRANDPEVYAAIVGEEERERRGIELIPSENYTYPEVFACNGSVMTNKYAEGYPGRRYYGGQEFTDAIERLAIARAKELFGAEHANVQPLSGSPMNQAVYMGFLEPGDKVLAMDLSHGGHLTHGAPVSHMGKIYEFARYKTKPDGSGDIDFDLLRAQALEHRPKMVLVGHSSYPRDYDYGAFQRIADEIGALTMADVSHIGGLIAGKALANPIDAGFDFVTTTTHKSLRGPRGGMILCKKEHAKTVDKAVFPGLQGGPHMNAIAGIAVTLGKALQPEFREYARATIANAKALAEALVEKGAKLVTGGTENHLMVVVTTDTYGIDGRVAEETLDEVSITVNKQIVPDDPNPPLRPSGIRLGTPAATTRGFGEEQMRQLAGWIDAALRHHDDEGKLAEIRGEVEALCLAYPVPGLS
ncbi:MAG: serine hydroxymethyltransferase [Acidobacteria bacterium]|nr:MAG: serine hydroxymethyltransferase [Acidobacteriota bacterium]REK01092.1 MAG: serine hydroxymethyltransferase [Acidobacteriota bacterium]